MLEHPQNKKSRLPKTNDSIGYIIYEPQRFGKIKNLLLDLILVGSGLRIEFALLIQPKEQTEKAQNNYRIVKSISNHFKNSKSPS